MSEQTKTHTPTIPPVETLLKAGVHFGHKTSKWHPSMEPFIFAERKGVHIIDLHKTVEALKKTLPYMLSIIQKGGILLIIGTKDQVQEKVKEVADETGLPYVNTKWVGGTLTNWSVIKRQIVKLKKMRVEKEKGEWGKYTKKEQILLQRELGNLEEMYGGISTLEKLPEALIVLDCKESKTALREAKVKDIPVIALCDTNVDIRDIQYPIPTNDDATKSLNLMLDLFKTEILKTKNPPAEATATEGAKEPTPRKPKLDTPAIKEKAK